MVVLQWHHWAAVKDTSAGTLRLYFDGVEIASGTGKVDPIANLAYLTIGARANGSGSFVGTLDDVRIYARALDAGEVADLAAGTVEPPANTAPVAVADSYSLDQDSSLNVAAAGVLSNDSDADGDALSAVLVADVSNGSLSLSADGSFTYTPTAGFSGSDSFSYQANDGSASSNVVVVDLTVTASQAPGTIELSPSAVVLVPAATPADPGGTSGTYVLRERKATKLEPNLHISGFANFDLSAVSSFNPAAGDTAEVSLLAQDNLNTSNGADLYLAQVTGGSWDALSLPQYSWGTASSDSSIGAGPGSQVREVLFISNVQSLVANSVHTVDVTAIVDAWINGGEANHGIALYLSDASQGFGFDQLSLSVTTAGGGNVAPTITSTAPTAATRGSAYSYQVTVSDPDDSSFSYALAGAPVGMSIDAAGLIRQPGDRGGQPGRQSDPG
ncbi:MAG: Ig-like domain-containing protein [Planctomycetota bacterium]|jgi:hypothetical protein